MTYYFARQMHQWLKADYKHSPDWKKYAKHHIASYAKLEPLRKYNLNLREVLSMYQKITGEAFSEKDEKLLYKLSAPISNDVSAASGVCRNVSLFKAISQSWAKGADIFILYGSGHAIVLEPALNSLMNS